ncbi:uncharacterized protein LOC108911277, partial [Anoplophora glabripennis]|uniref:uncharacterized protein LOC108911277 n=1 Tax=Anoplophora glabripennis TaxID=217634 RepID=UPI000874CEC6
MWIEFSKLVLCFYFCSAVASTTYQSQLDYIKRSDRYPSKYAVSSSSYNYKVSKSRYPNLEKVKTRIENMNNDAEPWGTKTLFSRIRHKGWTKLRPTTTTTTTTTTENGLFETYGDLEDGDLEDYDSL